MVSHTGARQAARLRQRYLEKALHQDISYYDTTLTSGGVLAGLNEDCTAIQNALSEKVCFGNCGWNPVTNAFCFQTARLPNMHNMSTPSVAIGVHELGV